MHGAQNNRFLCFYINHFIKKTLIDIKHTANINNMYKNIFNFFSSQNL